MYGMPGSRYGLMMEVRNLSEVTELVKEAQVAGNPAREFFVEGRRVSLSFDGMFLVDSRSNEIVEETDFGKRPVYTRALS